MSFFRHRWWCRVFAALLLLAAATGAPHGEQDDAGCGVPALEQHDESKHAISQASSGEHDHCAICHWSRSLRSPFSVESAAVVRLGAGALIPTGVPGYRQSPDLGNLPARAPPVRPA